MVEGKKAKINWMGQETDTQYNKNIIFIIMKLHLCVSKNFQCLRSNMYAHVRRGRGVLTEILLCHFPIKTPHKSVDIGALKPPICT